MALVRHFTETEMKRNSLHDEIDGFFSVLEYDGKTIVQIDTHGRKDREIPGKKSQTIQLDRDGAAALYKILKSAFHFE